MTLRVVVTKKNGDIAQMERVDRQTTINNFFVASGVSPQGKGFSRSFDWEDISDLFIIEE
jgi:hypothetical protein